MPNVVATYLHTQDDGTIKSYVKSLGDVPINRLVGDVPPDAVLAEQPSTAAAIGALGRVIGDPPFDETVTSLPPCRIDHDYLTPQGNPVVLDADFGTGPYAFVLSEEGICPAGLSLASDGTLSGTPEGPSQGARVPVTITDSLDEERTVNYSIYVLPYTLSALTVALPNATEDAPYDEDLCTVSAGVTGLTVADDGDPLPAGLAIAPPEGGGPYTLAGTPTVPGEAAVHLIANHGIPPAELWVSIIVDEAP